MLLTKIVIDPCLVVGGKGLTQIHEATTLANLDQLVGFIKLDEIGINFKPQIWNGAA
jgi:hypothetical protein